MKKAISLPEWALRLSSLICFLTIWELGSLVVGESLLLPGPLEVARRLLELMGQAEFYRHLRATLVRGIGGFALSFAAALAAGILASAKKWFRILFQPFLVLLRSVPLMALILLAVLWFRQNQVPYFVVFLIIFPIVMGNVVEGTLSQDPDILEMAECFRISPRDRLLHITVPHLVPFILSALSTGLGIAWKAVIAAEILIMPSRGIGTAMQRSQLELDSVSLFAWTISLLALSGMTDGLIRLIPPFREEKLR